MTSATQNSFLWVELEFGVEEVLLKGSGILNALHYLAQHGTDAEQHGVQSKKCCNQGRGGSSRALHRRDSEEISVLCSHSVTLLTSPANFVEGQGSS